MGLAGAAARQRREQPYPAEIVTVLIVCFCIPM
jgi:hypothetical protein